MTIAVTRLDDGLTFTTDRMDTVESVSLGAWVDVGTRHEAAHLNGVAHLLEHMAFKGTRRRSARDIAEEIEAVGGHLNAYTGRENTAFYAKVLAGDVPLAVDLIADLLQHATFEEAELRREREVVLQEIGQSLDTPDDIVFEQFQLTAYPEQPLGRPVLGDPGIVSSLSRDCVRGYLHDHYAPSRMVVAAAGRVDHDAFVELARTAFRDLPERRDHPIEPARYVGGEHREMRELEQIHLVLGLDGVGYHDPDYYAALVLSTLLGGGMSSRLFQEVRENRGLVYSIFSFVSAYSDGGLFGIYAGTGELMVEELIPVICDELGRVTHDVGEEEAQRARVQLKASTLMARESSSTRAEQLAQQILVYGRPLSVAEIVERIEAVDSAAIRRVATRLKAARPTLAVLGPVSRVERFDRLEARLA